MEQRLPVRILDRGLRGPRKIRQLVPDLREALPHRREVDGRGRQEGDAQVQSCGVDSRKVSHSNCHEGRNLLVADNCR